MYTSTKTYCHSEGLSTCYRQWRAKDSHCQLIHGYALEFRITFAANRLDERMWVVDFGGMKEVKAWLCEMFDHTLLVAQDDPMVNILTGLEEVFHVAKVHVVEHVGCEAFARMTFEWVSTWLDSGRYKGRVWVAHVEVREHGGNSAGYSG